MAPSWWCLSTAMRLAGASPVRISVRHTPEEERVSALIVSGGNDIGPELYGSQEAPRAQIDPERDALEIRWIEGALTRGIPLLGICRGAQLINAVLGGTLHHDVRPLRSRTNNRPGLLPTKQVALEPNSRVSLICKRNRLRVNSLHHQAIDRPGSDLNVVGRDLDDFCQVIEASDGRPIVGVQWHPEYLFYLPAQFALFRWLLRQAE